MVENVEMFEELDAIFKLRRLNFIRQLSYKRDPTTNPSDQKDDFSHTRYGHSFDVLAIANLLGVNAGLSKEDMMILQIAGVTHDYLTPAGGDTVKAIDMEAFDEDEHYGEIFKTAGWQEFRSKHGFSEEQQEKLSQTVLGKGLLGRLLDIADKLSYVSRDTDMYLNRMIRIEYLNSETNEYEVLEENKPSFDSIQKITISDPLVCAIWESVEVVNGEVVFRDPIKLANFLKLRALMFREVYYNIKSRSDVEMFLQEIVKKLYQDGTITREYLLNNGDFGLNSIVEKFTGVDMFPHFLRRRESLLREFSSIEEAREFAKTFNDNKDCIAILDNLPKVANSATGKFMVKKAGKIMPFSEACTEEAKEIDEIMNFPQVVHVYVSTFTDLGIPPSNREKVKAIFRIE